MLNFKKELEQWGPIDGNILYHSYFMLPMSGRFKSHFGITWPNLAGVLEHDKLVYRWHKGALEKEGKKTITRWLLDKKTRLTVWKQYQTAQKQLRAAGKMLDGVDGKTVPQAELKTIARVAYQACSNFWVVALIPETANFGAPAYLEKALKPFVTHEHMSEVLEGLLALDRLSFHQQSELELYRLVATSQNKQTLQHKLEKFSQKWHWLENSYFATKKLTAQDFARRARLSRSVARQKIQAITQYPKNVRKRKKLLARTYKIPQHILALADILSFSIWWQDERKGEIWRYLNKLDILVHMLAKKYSIPFYDLTYYTAEEFRDLGVLQKRVPAKVIKSRESLCVISMHNKTYKIITGRAARNIATKLNTTVTPVASNILRGITVSRGPVVQGRVRVLLSPRDAHRMKPGEILVTAMTSPDYIGMMRKAKAIITDTGGLMSHAAVVSRELGVPCVVGTKIATKILKDGTMVKVDTSTGTVTLLN